MLQPPTPPNKFFTQHHYICLAFLLLGLGHLLPWVTIVAAIDWWHYIYRNYTNTSDSIEYSLSAVYHSSLFISMTAATLYTANKLRAKQSIQSEYSLHSTINIIRLNFVVMFLSLLSILAFTWYTSTWLLLVLTGIIGFSEGLVRCEIYSMTAKIKTTDYTTSLMIGHTVAGILTCILRIATKAVFHNGTVNGLYQSVVVYFSIAAFILLLSIYTISKLSHNELLLRELDIHSDNTSTDRTTDSDQVDEQSPLLSNNDTTSTNGHNSDEQDVYVTTQHITVSHIYSLFWLSSVSTMLSFGTTMSLYPGLITSLHTVSHVFSNGWYAILLISLYNVGDLIGRVMCLIRRCMIHSTNMLSIAIIIRTVIFIPLFIVHTIIKHKHADNWFASDIVTYVLVILFGHTNGYLGTGSVIHAPIDVRAALTRHQNDSDKVNSYSNGSAEVTDFTQLHNTKQGNEQLSFALTFVGRTMALSLCLGTVLGSYCGLLIRYFVT